MIKNRSKKPTPLKNKISLRKVTHHIVNKNRCTHERVGNSSQCKSNQSVEGDRTINSRVSMTKIDSKNRSAVENF